MATRAIERRTPLLAAVLAGALGLFALGNGLAMLLDPQRWYASVPGVTATGAFNQHFIRDIGLIYALAGAAYLAGALRPLRRTLLWALPTLWLGGHALFHFWEVAAGICGPDAIPRDFVGVTLPALLGAGLSLWSGRR